ncbi:MAG: TIR domain-containing protein [Limnochordia bacterium]|jgi:hypothetical protein|nr:TIR domain-containing protein [Bacillota bacterium]NLM94878.1 TIR domain-containing protein [Bacillota bacterium]
MSKTYSLFISHAWKYHDDYCRLDRLLGAAPFSWKNYSVPKHDPVLNPDEPNDRKVLLEELKGQIRPTHCVLVLAGMYAAHSYWIQQEIDISLAYEKPIIGVRPWGQERIPRAVSDAARELVGWNTASIVAAIKKHSL